MELLDRDKGWKLVNINSIMSNLHKFHTDMNRQHYLNMRYMDQRFIHPKWLWQKPQCNKMSSSTTHWLVRQTKCCHDSMDSVMWNLCFRLAPVSAPFNSLVNKPECGFLVSRLSIWNPHSSEGIRRRSSVIYHCVSIGVTKYNSSVKNKKKRLCCGSWCWSSQIPGSRHDGAGVKWILLIKMVQRPTHLINNINSILSPFYKVIKVCTLA